MNDPRPRTTQELANALYGDNTRTPETLKGLAGLLPPEELADIACAPDEDDEAEMVNHPPHYTSHPSGVECISITEHMNFCLGNALKYIWRAGEKGDAITDLKKARWYLDREIARLKALID
jgi:hypothetical protein